MQPLGTQDLDAALKNLPHWEHEDGMLVTTFVFDDFLHAMTFVNAVASIADENGHHPTIIIDYDSVTLELTTHDADHKVTDKDVSLAHAIEDIDADFGVHQDFL